MELRSADRRVWQMDGSWVNLNAQQKEGPLAPRREGYWGLPMDPWSKKRDKEKIG